MDSIAQQVERRIGIPKVRVQIPLESTFFSWLRQCQIIMKKFLFMYHWGWFWNRPHFILYRWSPTNDGPTYDSSTLRWCDSDTHSVETVIRILNFDFFPGQAICGTILSWCWVAAQRQRSTSISQSATRLLVYATNTLLCCIASVFLDTPYFVFVLLYLLCVSCIHHV